MEAASLKTAAGTLDTVDSRNIRHSFSRDITSGTVGRRNIRHYIVGSRTLGTVESTTLVIVDSRNIRHSQQERWTRRQ